jgi:hypothetical protein
VAWHVYRARDPGRIPEASSSAADAVLPWLAMPRDAGAIARLTRCRVIVGDAECRRKTVKTALEYLLKRRLRNCVNREFLVAGRPA